MTEERLREMVDDLLASYPELEAVMLRAECDDRVVQYMVEKPPASGSAERRRHTIVLG
ncbi:MAG: hypothetical protein GY719_06770 [bacterium]|nr:hypothetical protein [bacterium]